MSNTRTLHALALGLACLLAQPSVAAPPAHNHAGHEHDHGAISPSNSAKALAGKKWETDAVLKAGMDQIRQTMVARRTEIELDRLTSRDYQDMGAAVERHLAAIVANCKLTPQVDQAFHTVVLADLTRDASLMRTSPKQSVQRLSAQGVLRTLRHYGEQFQHPGWSVDPASGPGK